MKQLTASLLVIAALTTACNRSTPEQEAAEVAVKPYLNVAAQQAAELPLVECAQALLPDGGVPGGSQSDIVTVSLRVDLPLGDPGVGAVLEQVGAVFWRSPVPLLRLEVSAYGGGVTLGPDGRPAAEGGTALDFDQLTALYGPRPSLPASLPPVQDPGSTRC